MEGRSFKQFLLSTRIEKARELIENKKLGISVVAGLVGFNDVSHFIKTFKKYQEKTPGDLRSNKQ